MNIVILCLLVIYEYLFSSRKWPNNVIYISGNYSCIEAEFVLRRDVAFFMILSYIPSALLVGLSWINFWLSMDAIPARITLGVLTLLTITSQTVGSNEDMPPVNYIKVGTSRKGRESASREEENGLEGWKMYWVSSEGVDVLFEGSEYGSTGAKAPVN